MQSNNFLQDDKGNYSMARFAVMMALVMGVYTGGLIPWVANASECLTASLGYFGIAITGKVTSKLTEGK
jgi:hypothetical protein